MCSVKDIIKRWEEKPQTREFTRYDSLKSVIQNVRVLKFEEENNQLDFYVAKRLCQLTKARTRLAGKHMKRWSTSHAVRKPTMKFTTQPRQCVKSRRWTLAHARGGTEQEKPRLIASGKAKMYSYIKRQFGNLPQKQTHPSTVVWQACSLILT